MYGFKVFVSYSTHDLPVVQQIKANLEPLGVSVFIAEYSVKPGENLKEQIETALKEADLVLVLWSKNAKDSTWVTDEVATARSAGKTILPILLEKDLKLPPFIQHLKYLHAYRPQEEWLPECHVPGIRRQVRPT